MLAICWSVAVKSCSLYAVAAQSKTHKAAFAIIFSTVGTFSTTSVTLVLITLSLFNV